MLRGSAPDDLAHALGTDRTQTRRAMEIGLPALITGLRDKTLEPGGAQNLASMLGEPNAALPADLDQYLAAGDPGQGAAMLDVAFGDRGEPALAALSTASGLSTRLLAQVMSVLAPLATGVVGAAAERSPDGLRSYLADAVADLEGKGFGRVVELVSPALPAGVDAMSVVDVDDDIDFTVEEVEIDPVPASPVVATTVIDDSVIEDNVVEGAFPEPDELVVLDDGSTEIHDRVEDLDLPDGGIGVNLSVPEEPDLTSVVPAGIDIAPDLEPAEMPMTIAEDPDLDGDLVAEVDRDIDGKGLSTMGWLWWVIGAILGVLLLLFAINQCGNDDPEVATTDTLTNEVAPTPTPDATTIARQNELAGLIAAYPGVTAELIGDVAVLTGSVENATEQAELDQAVRAAGFGVNNSVAVAQSVEVVQGYSLNDIIDAQPQLSTLRALLDQAGIGQALEGNGPFTLFAPTNEAFAAIQTEVDAARDNPEALAALLQYHVLSGNQDAAAVAASPGLTSLQGETIAVSTQGEAVLLNGSSQVLFGDAEARNGVLHIVSGVLVPPSSVQLPEELGEALQLAPITFALGSSDITDEGKVELDKVVAFLQATPGNIEIGGHTDSDGEPGFNQTLSQERADSVKAYLSSQGIPAESLTAVGFGEEQPIAPNDTPENKAKNRRIEFRPN